VDVLEVDAGDAEVAVAKLALDDDERHSFASHLDRVGVTQLMRSDGERRPRARCLEVRSGRRRWTTGGPASDR
jgi:hypothetical protein